MINIVLLVYLLVTAFMIVRIRHLFAVVMLMGVFSLLCAGLFVILDAVDVAFTEAAVGAGISTVLMLGALALTTRTEKPPVQNRLLPLVVVSITGAALIYGLWDVPAFGDADAPAMLHVMPDYIAGTGQHFSAPNVVTAVLASYRGFDTLGETGVIFTAGIGVLLLLNGGLAARRKKRKDGGAE